MNFGKTNSPVLITAEQMQNLLNSDDPVQILFTDVAFPVSYVSKQKEKCYIPNSVLFDFDTVFVDKHSGLPHTLPSPQLFVDEMSNLGVANDSTLIIYDDQGSFAAPRVWWMLNIMGHKRVFILDGGLQAWIDEGLPTTDYLQKSDHKTEYKVNFVNHLIVDKKQLLTSLEDADYPVVDARSPTRFNGTEAEPRKGVRSGHIPNAFNVHYANLIQDGKFVAKAEMKRLFEPVTKHQVKQVRFTCGSGVTACILALAAHEIGLDNWAVYDGSWSEWGADVNLPIE